MNDTDSKNFLSLDTIYKKLKHLDYSTRGDEVNPMVKQAIEKIFQAREIIKNRIEN